MDVLRGDGYDVRLPHRAGMLPRGQEDIPDELHILGDICKLLTALFRMIKLAYFSLIYRPHSLPIRCLDESLGHWYSDGFSSGLTAERGVF